MARQQKPIKGKSLKPMKQATKIWPAIGSSGRMLPTVLRSRKYGPGNQISYESKEARERDVLRGRIGRTPKAKVERPAPTDAMNRGTMGARAGRIGIGSGSRRR